MLPFTGMPLETMISKMQWRREYRYRYKYKKRERERIYNSYASSEMDPEMP